MKPNLHRSWFVVVLSLVVGWVGTHSSPAADPPRARKPIRALLVTGGPFHDYHRQAKILTEGTATRANVEWTVINEEKNDPKARMELFEKPDWAAGYDVVVHNECFADVADPAYVGKVVAPHRGGVPAVVLHCAMHTFRSMKSDEWREFLGVTTTHHGPQHPLTVRNTQPDHPIMRAFPESWTTGNEELYWIDKLWPESVALATAEETTKKVYPVIWTHRYGPDRTKVFGSTLAHNDRTMTDPVFLDLFARGLLWTTDQLDDAGKPVAGAGPVTPEPR